MKMPYTQAEAEQLCNQYQSLIGKPLSRENCAIKQVVITPYDAVNKQRFFMYFLLFDNDAVNALSIDYQGAHYDIELLAYNSNDELVHESLTQWLSINDPAVLATILPSACQQQWMNR